MASKCKTPIENDDADLLRQIGPPNKIPVRPDREGGAFAIMFLMLLIVIIGFCGLAIDTGLLYNRKVDLSGIARAAALAAARELNGTSGGISDARASARATVERLKYQYFKEGVAVQWDDGALSFGASPSRSGTWLPASSAGSGNTAEISSLYFAKVDTAGLGTTVNTVRTFFLRLIPGGLRTIQLNDSAIAGKTAIKVTPIAICAMSPTPATPRASTGPGATLSELVQYGFRRGISYNLMQLNPNGITPVRFAVNPVLAPGVSGPDFSIASLGPFVCSGTMWAPRLTGGTIRVSPLPTTAPLASLFIQLNSRFDVYTDNLCKPNGAPPDVNIKPYAYDQSGTQPGAVKWMTPAVGSPAAATTTVRHKLETVADLDTAPVDKGSYGPLWAYAKAAKMPSTADGDEPATGYETFATTQWASLYPPGPSTSNYPTSPPSPYQTATTISGTYLAPRNENQAIAVRQRRVLNVPLLSCTTTAPSAVNSEATVSAIGKFFMTVPATEENLIAEFAGLVSGKSLPADVELYP